MHLFRTTYLTLIFILVGFSSFAGTAWREGEFRGTVILTISGNIERPSRGPSSVEFDKFFTGNDESFTKATQFDVAALSALPQVSVSADFPKNGPVSTFEGPLLADVLHVAGASGKSITLRALGNYVVKIPLAEAISKGAVIALKRDGIPFAIGDFGPIQLVFPRAERFNLSNMPDDWWVWAVYHIEVN